MTQPAKSSRFRVALSFPGEHRARVEKIAETLAAHLGHEKVLYDEWYRAEFARPNLDAYLPELYYEQSQLLVFFLCEAYSKKEWCGLEWRAGRELLKRGQDDRLMFLRLDNADIPGLYSIDGYLDIGRMADDKVAAAILQRLGMLNPPLATEKGHRVDPSSNSSNRGDRRSGSSLVDSDEEEKIRNSDPANIRFTEYEISLSATWSSFVDWLRRRTQPLEIISIQEDSDRENTFCCSGKPGTMSYPIEVLCKKDNLPVTLRFDLITDWLHPRLLAISNPSSGIPWDTSLFPIKSEAEKESRISFPNTTLRDAEYWVLFAKRLSSAATVTGTTTIVFDDSYRQHRWHAQPVISAGYRAVAAAAAGDYAVTSNASGYESVDTLAERDILILPMPFGTLVEERHYDNVAKWVLRGGRLMLLGLYLMETHHYSNLNNLSRRFGFDFSPNLTMPPGREDFRQCISQAFAFANREFWIRTKLISAPTSHPIVEGIATLTITSSCTIDPAGTPDLLVSTADSVAVLRGRGHKNPEGRLVQLTDYVLDRYDSAPLIVALRYGAGRVVGIGSWKVFVNELVEDEQSENMRLFRNLIKWLSQE